MPDVGAIDWLVLIVLNALWHAPAVVHTTQGLIFVSLILGIMGIIGSPLHPVPPHPAWQLQLDKLLLELPLI